MPALTSPRSTTPPAPASSALPPPKRLPVLLRRAWYGLNQGFRDRIEHLAITPNQFSILRWLSEGDAQGLSQRTLVDLMASDPNTVSATLARMEESGLIARVPHERDGRASRVRLKAAGREVMEKALPVALDFQEEILAALPPGRRMGFLEELAVIAEACGDSAEKP